MIKKIIHKLADKNRFIKRALSFYVFRRRRKRLLKTIVPNLKQQLKDNPHIPSRHSSPKILIPWIETSHYVLYLILIIAKALQLRGAEIKFLYCGGTLGACENKSIRTKDLDVCRDCKLFQKHILPLFGLDTCELKDFINPEKIGSINEKAKTICNNYPDSYCFHSIDLTPAVNDSVLRFYYGGEPKSEDELAELRAQHLTTAMVNTEVAKNLYHTYQPDIVLGLMYAYTAWQPYVDYYRKHNVNTVFLGMTQLNYNAVVMNKMDYFLSNDRLRAYLSLRKEELLNQEEKKILYKFMNKRFSGADQFFQKRGMYTDKFKKKDIVRLLKINPNKRNIFLFSNLFWDVGLSQRGGLYNNVIDWVLSTIELVKGSNHCHLYVEPHPMEKFSPVKSLKSIRDYISEKYPTLPSNVSIIPPELKIKPYDLYDYMDLGIFFSGTLGIESLLNNIPVVITGKAPYRGLGLCYEPTTEEDYRHILLGNKDKMTINQEMVELFCYFYFIKACIPFNIMKPVYGNSGFEKYNINSSDDLLPGKDHYLDHICDCILKNKTSENW